jgi:hypothetical protein
VHVDRSNVIGAQALFFQRRLAAIGQRLKHRAECDFSVTADDILADARGELEELQRRINTARGQR